MSTRRDEFGFPDELIKQGRSEVMMNDPFEQMNNA